MLVGCVCWWRLGADDVAVTRPNGKSGYAVIDEVFDPARVVLVYQRAVIFIGQEWRVIFSDDLGIEQPVDHLVLTLRALLLGRRHGVYLSLGCAGGWGVLVG